MKEIILSIFALTVISTSVNAQNVNIPDANFKSYLVGNAAINTNGDTEIQVTEASAFNGTINCFNLGITDLAGVEAFTAITELICGSNNLSSLDVSANINLEHLFCNDNNNLNSLNLSANTALTELYCNNNNLNSLDVSANNNLLYLYCYNNNLNSLDVSANNNLVEIECQNNSLSSLDVSTSTNLLYLYCSNNNLSSLDLSANTSLFEIECQNNNLSSLDVSANINLGSFRCDDNNLSSLNVANGDNGTSGLYYVNATNNPNLTCIQHDTGFNPTTNSSWTKDATASWSDNCNFPCTVNVPDANFKAYLIGNTAINTNGDTEIQCSEASAFTGGINCSFLTVLDMTGLEAFTSLTYLDCSNNYQLTSLDVTNNTELSILYCSFGLLSTLNLSANINLEYLSVAANDLTTLDVTNSTNLVQLSCQNNELTSLFVGATNITTNFNASNNPNLTCIQVDDVAYSTTNWTNIDPASSFSLNCVGPVLVSSINVQGQGGSSAITTSGGTLQMEATVLPANADDATYIWSVTNGTGTATIDAAGVLTAITDGTVDVVATANDGSGITGIATITITNQSVGLNEFDSQNISIYPNPVANELFIDLAEGQINQIQIIDYTGRVIKSISDKQLKNIDVSNLTQGIYILKVSTENGISTQQFIKK